MVYTIERYIELKTRHIERIKNLDRPTQRQQTISAMRKYQQFLARWNAMGIHAKDHKVKA